MATSARKASSWIWSGCIACGLRGFQNFDAALATPQVVDHRLAYMTPEWKDAFKYATTLADQLGMEEAIAAFAGLERNWRPLGPGLAGNEEVCVE